MIVSSRASFMWGFGLIGLGLITGSVFGQAGAQDRNVQRSASQTGAASAPAASAPLSIGTVDFDKVFKDYEKVEVLKKEFQSAAMSKRNDLMKISAQAQEEMTVIQKLDPRSPDYKKHENKITQLKAELEANREQAERDFSLREAEMLATIYKEIQDMVRRVAQFKHLTYVIKVSKAPVNGSDPQSVMAAMANPVLYADASNDITEDVIKYLNTFYRQATGAATPKPAAAAAATGAAPKTTR
jgi:outer membrane protein